MSTDFGIRQPSGSDQNLILWGAYLTIGQDGIPPIEHGDVLLERHIEDNALEMEILMDTRPRSVTEPEEIAAIEAKLEAHRQAQAKSRH